MLLNCHLETWFNWFFPSPVFTDHVCLGKGGLAGFVPGMISEQYLTGFLLHCQYFNMFYAASVLLWQSMI